MLEQWRDLVAILRPITSRRNATERRLELVTGGVIEFWSLDNPDASRGRKYKRVIIDEAAMVKNLSYIWGHVLRPTLADYIGDAWFLSTPKGRNGFWRLYQMGQDSHMNEWSSWTMPTYANPFISRDEVESMAGEMTEAAYNQEILARFIEDGAGVFRHVRRAATATPQPDPIPGHDYLFGVDWGKHADFTVITVIDITDRSLVYMDRFNQIDYVVQSDRLKALYERFSPHTIIAERNSIGDPVIERLVRDGLPVQPFQTTNATKAAAIESLALAFERDDIRIIDDDILTGELIAYESERLPSGLTRYNAPAGYHDDCVMSLAMAWQGMTRPAPAGTTATVDTDIYKAKRNGTNRQRNQTTGRRNGSRRR